MTIDEFLLKLAEHADGTWRVGLLVGNGQVAGSAIRSGGRCPIECVVGRRGVSGEAELGLSRPNIARIMAAADSARAGDPALRARLLTAVGLS